MRAASSLLLPALTVILVGPSVWAGWVLSASWEDGWGLSDLLVVATVLVTLYGVHLALTSLIESSWVLGAEEYKLGRSLTAPEIERLARDWHKHNRRKRGTE